MIRTAKGRSRIIAIITCFMLFFLCLPVRVCAEGEISAEGTVAGEANNENTSGEDIGYPDILADEYYQSELEGKGFELNDGSRFYIVTDEITDPESSGTDNDTSEADKQAGTDASGDDEQAGTDASGDDINKRVNETVELMTSLFASYGIPSQEPLFVFYGAEDYALPGDIVIRLTSGGDSQSYKLDITDRAVITSAGDDGIYYGLLTLLQIALRTKASNEGLTYNYYYGWQSNQSAQQAENNEGAEEDTGNLTIGKFSFEDGPDLEERAIFLDCGRKYFDAAWIRNLIRRASFQRYNTLILHFSEAQGLRLDSRVFPWLTEDIDSLTMTEMSDIVKFANRYHMNVIPSFDVPGHNKYIIDKYSAYMSEHPDFTFEYKGKTYGPEASIANHYSHNGYIVESNSIGIDITEEHDVAFMDALIDDYAEFFRSLGCTDFDMGGDEVLGYASFNIGGDLLRHETRWDFVEHWADYAQGVMKIPGGSASDTYIHYLNRTALRLMDMGYTCRVFNDEIDINGDQHFKLLPSVELSYWNAGRRSAKHFAKEGHKLYNCVSRWCYFASGRAEGVDIMNGKYYTVNGLNIYDNWDPFAYSSTTYNPKPVPVEAAGGGYFCIWCDEPDYKSQETIWQEIEMRTWANSAKLWRSNHKEEETADTDQQDAYYQDTYDNEPQIFSYYELEAFAGLARGDRDYNWFSGENHAMNGSGKPISGEGWWKLMLKGFN